MFDYQGDEPQHLFYFDLIVNEIFSSCQYAKDLRYESKCGEGVATHDHQSRAAVAATALSSITHLANNYSVIGIDEGQFVREISGLL